MDFKKPVIVYTAATNVEAHLIVDMLHANGVPAHAVEDQSGVSLGTFGTISQFHATAAGHFSIAGRELSPRARRVANPFTARGKDKTPGALTLGVVR